MCARRGFRGRALRDTRGWHGRLRGKEMSTAIVAHSGGPTPVINATLLGVIEEARLHAEITSLYGARFGIGGILSEDFIDLFRQPQETVMAVALAPSSALGSSRREVHAEELDRVLAVFRAHDVRYFFY